jgi:predicted NBD/HSP70 family sugar kinase
MSKAWGPGTAQPFNSFGLAGTNLERASVHNRRVTLKAIRANAPVTIPELVRITELTAPAVTGIVRELHARGWVRDAGRTRGARGQPAMRYVIDPDGAFSIGVNIDRDHVTIVALDLLGTVRVRMSEEIDFALPDAVQALFAREWARMVDERLIDAARLVGIGIALPDALGMIDLPGRPPDYAVWSTVDVTRLFAPICPVPAHVANDASAAAIGEMLFGHGLGNPDFFYMLVSRGLGAGVVLEGVPATGASGRSGEIGFLPVRGRRGAPATLQDTVSLSGLYRQLAEGGCPVEGIETLDRLDEQGEAIARAWAIQAAELLDPTLTVINAALNPGAFYIGGRLPAWLVDVLAGEINARMRAHAGDLPAIAPAMRAALAADAAAVGAAILPMVEELMPTPTR